MSFGSTAYESYVRIHSESGRNNFPKWSGLTHVGRMAWEAAAQAVALSVLPSQTTAGFDDDDEFDEGDFRDTVAETSPVAPDGSDQM